LGATPEGVGAFSKFVRETAAWFQAQIAVPYAMAPRTRPSATFWLCFAVAAASGAAAEIGIGLATHRREAWDTGVYWSMGVPLMVLTALVCGFAARERPAVIGYAPFVAQLVALVVRTGGGSMLPLGIALMAVIGLSGVAAAFLGGRLGRAVLGRPDSAA
jgi:hypothetical protein